MKSIILLFCFAAFVIAEETYDTSSDNINLDELLGNERLITSYSKCLINQGPCTPEVKKLKGKKECIENKENKFNIFNLFNSIIQKVI